MVQIIAKNQNGIIFKCDKCNSIHIEFKNLGFNFSERQFFSFRENILNLDGEKWEKKNEGSCFTRKIMIPTGHRSINFLLNNNELEELKQLLMCRKKGKIPLKSVSTSSFPFTPFSN